MLWMLAFWLTAALLLAPLPFKLVALFKHFETLRISRWAPTRGRVKK